MKPIKAVQKFKFLIKGEESHNDPNVNDKPAEQSLSPIAQHLGIKDEIESHYPTDMLSERKWRKVIFGFNSFRRNQCQ